MSTTDNGIVCSYCGVRLDTDEAYAYHISHDPPNGCWVVSVAFGSAWPSLGGTDAAEPREPRRNPAAPGHRACVQCDLPASPNVSLCAHHLREYNRTYYAANRDKARESQKAWREANRESLNARKRAKYAAARAGAGQ